MPSDNDPIYLVDGSAYIYRAYHAITPLTNAQGLFTHAAYGFVGTILRIIKERQPSHLLVAFDQKGPTFRHDIYPEYKANRPPMPEDLSCQIPYIHELVAALGIPALAEEGVEADDLIASAARVLSEQGREVIVVSGDKDLLQLVGDKVCGWEPMKDVVLDQDFVLAKYGVAVSQLLDFFALIGDKSDNVPGISGVGPKTAAKLLTEYGSLDELLANLAELKKSKMKERLIEQQEMARLSRDLIRLKEDVAVPREPEAYAMGEPDQERLKELYQELEFKRLLKELSSEATPAATFAYETFQLVSDVDELKKLVAELQRQPLLVIDTETTSLNPLTARLVGISLTSQGDKAWYIPLAHCDEEGRALENQLSLAQVQATLGPLLTNPEIAKIAHNLKYDLRVLAHHNLPLAGPLHDTLLVSYLLDPGRRSHGLDDLAQEFLGLTMTSFTEVTNKDKKDGAFGRVTPQAACHYSCEDVVATRLLWAHLHQQLAQQTDMWELYSEVEMSLVPILAEMEESGVLVDREALAELSSEFAAKLKLLAQTIHDMAGEEFNINSPKQLGTILFETLGLPHGRKTKTGYSTDVKVLEKLAASHPLPAAVLEYRSLSKLKSTYADGLTEQIEPTSGRIHTSFNQAVTATGRLSSSNPNLQNIPIRSEEGQRIRASFIAPPHSCLLAVDYSQIDLRVLAHYSQDETLLAAFRQGADIHQQTAAEIFRVNPMLITPDMRRVAKTINFGIVYGMSAFGLAGQLKISRKEAQTFITRYFQHYAGVERFMGEIVETAKKQGYVTTLLGRRRYLPEITSRNKTRRDFAERTAINSPIQGTAADIMKLATIKCHQALAQHALQAKMVLQIHDELVFETPDGERQEVSGLVKEVMESVLELDVPLLVNISSGQNLAKG
ncbi:MAG: DNA polymerase I, partial [Thermodesulfobacteriota bacterium]